MSKGQVTLGCALTLDQSAKDSFLARMWFCVWAHLPFFVTHCCDLGWGRLRYVIALFETLDVIACDLAACIRMHAFLCNALLDVWRFPQRYTRSCDRNHLNFCLLVPFFASFASILKHFYLSV